MISIIIPTLNDQSRLVGCLSPLVAASMAGLVRELIVVDAGSTDDTLEIADDAGADILRSDQGLGAGVAAAKGPWLLILDPKVRLERGWELAVQRHLDASRQPARFKLYRADSRFPASLLPPRALAVLFLKEAGHAGGGGLDTNALRRRARLLDARGSV